VRRFHRPVGFLSSGRRGGGAAGRRSAGDGECRVMAVMIRSVQGERLGRCRTVVRVRGARSAAEKLLQPQPFGLTLARFRRLLSSQVDLPQGL
jgi:hypothetical protein